MNATILYQQGNLATAIDAGAQELKPYAPIRENASSSPNCFARENESAEILVKNGFSVEQNPTAPGSKKPDYVIDAKIFDNYTLTTKGIRNIASAIEGKVNSGQANNVVLNLSDSEVSAKSAVDKLEKYPIENLKKVIIIENSEASSILGK